jgi:hypothetical protein
MLERLEGYVHANQNPGPAAKSRKDIARAATDIDNDFIIQRAGGGRPSGCKSGLPMDMIKVAFRPPRITKILSVRFDRFRPLYGRVKT